MGPSLLPPSEPLFPATESTILVAESENLKVIPTGVVFPPKESRIIERLEKPKLGKYARNIRQIKLPMCHHIVLRYIQTHHHSSLGNQLSIIDNSCNLPITFCKDVRTCTQHPTTHFVLYNLVSL